MRYEIELYDHTEHQKVIVYTYGQDEVEAALAAMDKAPEPGILKNIKQIRDFYVKANLQFIGIKLIELGDRPYEVPKSPKRDKQPESKKKTRRSATHRHY